MDFASSARAAENKTRWKKVVANSSVVPQRPSNVMGGNRIRNRRLGEYFSAASVFVHLCLTIDSTISEIL